MSVNWRSTTHPEVVEDVDSLTEDGVEAAADFLSRHGSFTPFMLTIAIDGERELRHLGVQPPTPDAHGMVRALTLSGDVDRLRARACVLDVVVGEPFTGDAIEIKLEHRAGFCSDLLVPYQLSDEELAINMEQANAATGTPALWGRAGLADSDRA